MTDINLKDWGYDPEQEINITIKGNQLLHLIQFLDSVEKSETTPVSFLHGYAKSTQVETILNDEGVETVGEVKTEWEVYPNLGSFMDQNPVESVSLLGAMAIDLKQVYQSIHYFNIEDGIAKKLRKDGGEL